MTQCAICEKEIRPLDSHNGEMLCEECYVAQKEEE